MFKNQISYAVFCIELSHQAIVFHTLWHSVKLKAIFPDSSHMRIESLYETNYFNQDQQNKKCLKTNACLDLTIKVGIFIVWLSGFYCSCSVYVPFEAEAAKIWVAYSFQ